MSPAAPLSGGPGEVPQVSEQELQQALYMGEQLRAQIMALEEQRAYLQTLMTEYTRGRAALEGLQKATEGEEMLVPVGGGAFIHAKVVDPNRIVSSIGSGVHIESNVESALARLQERLQGVESAAQRVDQELARLTREMSRLQAGLEALGMG